MNAQHIGLPLADDAEEDEPSYRSSVHATRELAAPLLGIGAEAPAWSSHPPAPLLPHDPLAFDAPPALPRARDVAEAAFGESLGGDLAWHVF